MAVQIDVAGTFIDAADLTPAGAIICFGGAAAPTGWLLCDDSAVSRTTYADLFTVIGTTYGVGNGSTTFNVPDMRGVFVRGAGTAGTLTNANGSAFTAVLAATENDKIQGHYHKIATENGTALNELSGGDSGTVNDTTGQAGAVGSGKIKILQPRDDGSNGTPRTGTETSPANLALSYIIKT